MLAAERGRSGERYLLGGENITLREVLNVVERVTYHVRRRVWVPPALAVVAGHVAELIAVNFTGAIPVATAEAARIAMRSRPIEIGKAQRELGYQPRCAELALRDSIEWLSGLRRECQ